MKQTKSQTVKIKVYDQKTKQYEEVEVPANSDIANFKPTQFNGEGKIKISRESDGMYTMVQTVEVPGMGRTSAVYIFSKQGKLINSMREHGFHNLHAPREDINQKVAAFESAQKRMSAKNATEQTKKMTLLKRKIDRTNG